VGPTPSFDHVDSGLEIKFIGDGDCTGVRTDTIKILQSTDTSKILLSTDTTKIIGTWWGYG
jgi:hypothetical protein